MTCNIAAFSQNTVSVFRAGWMRELAPENLLSDLAGGCPWPDFLLGNVDLPQAC